MQVDIQHPIEFANIPSDQQIQAWINTIFKDPQERVLIRIVDNEESQQLNFQYRQKNYPTNVLSFVDDLPLEVNPFIGDLVICAPLVEQQAQQQNKSIQAHWAHLIIHGILHLRGFDHQTPEEAIEMETQEINALKQLQFNNPYEELD